MFFTETNCRNDFIEFKTQGAVAIHERASVGSAQPKAIAIAAAPEAIAHAQAGLAVSTHVRGHARACAAGSIAVALDGEASNPEGLAIATSIATSSYASGHYVVAVGIPSCGRVERGQLGIALDGATMIAYNGSQIILRNGQYPSLVWMDNHAAVYITAADEVPATKYFIGNPEKPVVGYWAGQFRCFADRNSALEEWEKCRQADEEAAG